MEIQRADQRLRRTAMVVVVAAAALGGVALWALQRWLDGVAAGSRGAGSLLALVFGATVGVNVLALAALGAYLWRYGARVRAASQFPPPGARVIRDTPVLRGSAALRRGRLLQGLGASFVVCCVGLAAAAWRFHALFPLRTD